MTVFKELVQLLPNDLVVVRVEPAAELLKLVFRGIDEGLADLAAGHNSRHRV